MRDVKLWCETCRDVHGPSGPHVGEIIPPDKAELLREIDRQHACELDVIFAAHPSERNRTMSDQVWKLAVLVCVVVAALGVIWPPKDYQRDLAGLLVMAMFAVGCIALVMGVKR